MSQTVVVLVRSQLLGEGGVLHMLKQLVRDASQQLLEMHLGFRSVEGLFSSELVCLLYGIRLEDNSLFQIFFLLYRGLLL
jgi:hypothetical protein